MRKSFASLVLLFSSLASAQTITTLIDGSGGVLVEPRAVAFDPAGNVYAADTGAGAILRIDATTGVVTPFAGNGTRGFSGDGGLATAASISPAAMAFDAAGNAYFADGTPGDPHRIRKIAAGTSIITTIAGTGAATPYPGDGVPAVQAAITPRDIAVDSGGNVYMCDNVAVRKVAASSGLITTLRSYTDSCQSIALDTSGNLFIARMYNSLPPIDVGIEKLELATGIATRIPNTSFPNVLGLSADPTGNLYVGLGNSIARLVPGTGSSVTVAGGCSGCPLGDGGPATQASINKVWDVAVSPAGDALALSSIPPQGSGPPRIRRVAFSGLFVAPDSLTFDGRLAQTTSLPKRITIANLAPTAVSIASITPSANFSESHDCSSSQAGGSTCFIDVSFTPPANGPYSGTLAIDASSGALSIPLAGSAETSLVTHYYESILRRAPDSSGKPFWDGERTRMEGLGANVNETWFAMSSYFFAGAEYSAFNRDNTAFVTDLYKTFFNRAPDASGQQFWLDQMANGMPREVVLTSFQHSPEFDSFTQGLFGNNPARAEVDMVMDFYRGLLGRLPDTDGFNGWVAQFRSAQCASDPGASVTALATSMSESFATSSEYVNKNRTNAQYVGDLYNAFLRRGGDINGVNVWINALNSGTFTRKQERDAFRGSSEFTTRVNAVAAQGCLT